MLLMWFLASIPLGLSVAGMGGLTWMIRHQGSAIFSWWLVFSTLGVGSVGCVRVFWWVLATTWAHDVCVGIRVVFLMGSGLWGCMVSGMKSMSLSSSSITLLVRYALVSARLAIMCLSMLSSMGPPMSFMKQAAQFVASSLGRIWVALAVVSSSRMSSSLIFIHLTMYSSSSDRYSSWSSPISENSLSNISGQLNGFTSWYLVFAFGVWLILFSSEGSFGEGVMGLDVECSVMSRPSSSCIDLLL